MDFTPFLVWLQSLGPLGHLAAIFLGAMLPALLARVKSQFSATPARPVAPETLATSLVSAPGIEAAGLPELLKDILPSGTLAKELVLLVRDLLTIRHTNTAPNVVLDEPDAADLVKQRSALDKQIASKRAALQAALDKLATLPAAGA